MQKTAIGGLFTYAITLYGHTSWLPPQLLRIMRILTFFLFVVCLSASASGTAQSVTISGKALTYKQVFAAIEKQTGYVVGYDRELLSDKKTFSLSVSDMPLSELLDMVLKDHSLKYEIADKTIFISRLPEAVPSKQLMFPLPPVRVQVTGSNGKPLSGASVINRNTKHSAVTDADGVVSLNVSAGDVIEITFVGYEKQSVTIKDVSATLSISLKPSESRLDEVVVSGGYYTTSVKTKTGNISRIEGDQIKRQPVTSPLMALQGRVPGLDITPATGLPTSAPKIRIRGQNSLRKEQGRPLYVIDGLPVDSRPIMSSSSPIGPLGAGLDPLSTIDPDNIESIEVLKDADATAIYGSRGANGVILVTTSKGIKGEKLGVNVNGYKGVGSIPNRLDLMNTEAYLAMRREALRNDNASPQWYQYDINGAWDTTRYTDWQDKLMGGRSQVSDLSIGLSGGSEQTNIALNIAHHGETLITPGDFGNKQLSGHFSLSHKSVNEKFRLNMTTQYASRKMSLCGDQNLVYHALTLPPNAPAIFNDDGTLNWEIVEPFPNYRRGSWVNPYSRLLNTQEIDETNLILSGNISYEVAKGINLTILGGITDNVESDVSKSPLAATDPTRLMPGYTAAAVFADNRRNTWIVEPAASIQKHLGAGGKTVFNAVIGATWQHSNSAFTKIDASGYTSDALLHSLLGAPNKTYAQDQAQYRYVSGYTRIGFEHAQKYILNLTGRRDGSSRFGPNHRFGNFWSVGGAWIFSEENFLRSINPGFLSFGKIRGSIGVTGSDQIPDYGYLETYSISSYLHQGSTTLNPTSLYNNNIRWERTQKTEIALELSFLRNRISAEASVYRHTSSNQFVSYGLPFISGFSSVDVNLPAEIRNSGFELMLSTKNISTKAFEWTTSANVTVGRNKLVSYPGIEESSYAQIYAVGQPLSTLRLYHWKGVDPATGEHMIADTDENGRIDDNDRIFTRSTDRRFYGGLLNNLRYRGFSLSFLCQFSSAYQFDFMPSAPPGATGNQSRSVLSRWTKEGQSTNVGRFTQVYGDAYFRTTESDRNTFDAYFVRLKTLSLNYNVPQKIIGKAKLTGLNIYAQCQNLFTITNYDQVLDPETGNSLPPLRMVSLGFQLKL